MSVEILKSNEENFDLKLFSAQTLRKKVYNNKYFLYLYILYV